MTMQTNDLLFEIGTEELPARLLKSLSTALAEGIAQGLKKAALEHGEIHSYATPRRLAIVVQALQNQQPNRAVERKGPALSAAFDSNGQPTPALEGFIRSCHTTFENLTKIESEKGGWLVYRYEEVGKPIAELVPEIISKVLNTLPIPKPMLWGDQDIAFVRPVHWIVLMYGKEIIPATLLGLESGRTTYGHRFHSPKSLKITEAKQYNDLLKNNGFVIPDFDERQHIIRRQLELLTTTVHSRDETTEKFTGKAIGTDKLLEEVTGLVEWPVAVIASFEPEFLTVPHEALIAAMEVHQKSFPLEDSQHRLLPYFITISNIQSREPKEVVRGNERVMRARLADAKFFYETDCKRKLEARLEDLKNIVFQAKLGSLHDKSVRIQKLAEVIAKPLGCEKSAARAGLLAKSDLASAMVGEFPELQGIMGDYYARNDQEPKEVATAIREHYLPRFAGDDLPATFEGCAVGLADRLDTLVGIFSLKQIPTGDKDPFGLRRAAVGILRILIEKQLSHNLYELLEIAQQNYQPTISVAPQVHEFILERLRAWYADQDISADTLAAVLTVQNKIPQDIDQRVKAVKAFRRLPEAQALAAANKRVSNILKQANESGITLDKSTLQKVDSSLFTTKEEQVLFEALSEKFQQLFSDKSNNYTDQLIHLATLRDSVDQFFDVVLVMDENEKIRNNRLELLTALRKAFLQVADISLLQSEK